MKLLIDSANIEHIKQINHDYPVDGVTTNPTLIAKENRDFYQLIKEIRTVIGESKLLFVQTVSEATDAIVQEALEIWKALDKNVVIKIPVTVEGIKAIKELKKQGIKTLATTVYTPMNAFVAAKAGADYVAPYVNRIENLNGKGTEVVQEIKQIFTNASFTCEIISASFKNVQQIKEVCLSGSDVITVPPTLINQFLQVSSIKEDVERFKLDWQKSIQGKEG
ncbi:transaldolase family protein [Virgibacillus dokdonensis]|uniref:Transaldolase n=1 Tax=Virgibacillus dokdonensis TaxID=302167 RepID=A0A2K9IV21_9BACI|nr:transaldolase family protein [Virgibacillus dokdonensis]AUJ23597.1 Transaldolase [Virgibacillus dokdonensis]